MKNIQKRNGALTLRMAEKHSLMLSESDRALLSAPLNEGIGEFFKRFWGNPGGEGVRNYVADYITEGILHMLGIKPNGILADVFAKTVSQVSGDMLANLLKGEDKQACRVIAKGIVKGVVRGVVSQGLQSEMAKAITDTFGIEHDSLFGGIVKAQVETFFSHAAVGSEYGKYVEKHVGDFFCELDFASMLKAIKAKL